jgi:DNA modification methylase
MSAFMSQYIPNYEPLLYCYKHGKSPKWYGANNEKCIWEQQVELKNRIHPTQKPVELPARAIKNSSQENGIVMDLFGGSGSTLIACEQLNRNCYMMELDEKYVDVIVNRYIKFKGTDEDVMLERDGKQTQYKEVTKWQVADQRKK